jgi:hypothetical protein
MTPDDGRRPNDFRLRRYRTEFASGDVLHQVEVVIDGVELSDLLEEVPDFIGWSWIPLSHEHVAPPSRHWLGAPPLDLRSGQLVAIADGGCGVWECCGPGAPHRVHGGDRHVEHLVPGHPGVRSVGGRIRDRASADQG